MPEKAMTVEDALDAIDGKRTWICGTQHVLAAEVRRLRELVHTHDGLVECQRADEAEAEVRRLREERDLFRDASAAAELRIVELRAKVTQLETDLTLSKYEGEDAATLEQIEATCEQFGYDPDSGQCASNWIEAEVRLLRAQVAAIANGPWLELAATLARVEALPEKWRSDEWLRDDNDCSLNCAVDLEAALRGEP